MARQVFRRKRRRLDKKVTFLIQSEDKNEFNEREDVWTDQFTTRCATTPAPGTEKFANRENIESAPTLVEVREEARTLALTTQQRLRIGTKVYEIAALDQPERGANIIVSAVYNGE